MSPIRYRSILGVLATAALITSIGASGVAAIAAGPVSATAAVGRSAPTPPSRPTPPPRPTQPPRPQVVTPPPATPGAAACSTTVALSGSVAAASATCGGTAVVEVFVSSTVDGRTVSDTATGIGGAAARVDGGDGLSCLNVARITVDGAIVVDNRSSSTGC